MTALDLMMGGMVLSNGESTYGAEHLHLTRYNNSQFASRVLSKKAYEVSVRALPFVLPPRTNETQFTAVRYKRGSGADDARLR